MLKIRANVANTFIANTITRSNVVKALILSALMIAGTQEAAAFNSIVDTANILGQGTHRLQLTGQGIFNEFEGMNAAARFSTAVSPDSEVQFEMGTGSVDFNGGVFVKYTPFPDTDDQPAIGMRLGYSYGKENDNSISKFHLQPMVSKIIETQQGRFVPYAVLPLSVTTYNGSNFVPVHVVLGSEWQPTNLKKVRFMAEYGFNAIHAYNYLSISAALDFDGSSFLIE